MSEKDEKQTEAISLTLEAEPLTEEAQEQIELAVPEEEVKEEIAAEPEKSDEVKLLEEIRDLMKK